MLRILLSSQPNIYLSSRARYHGCSRLKLVWHLLANNSERTQLVCVLKDLVYLLVPCKWSCIRNIHSEEKLPCRQRSSSSNRRDYENAAKQAFLYPAGFADAAQAHQARLALLWFFASQIKKLSEEWIKVCFAALSSLLVKVSLLLTGEKKKD